MQYLAALGAVFCWASLPISTGTALESLSVPELLAFSFVPAAVYLWGQHLILHRTWRLQWPGRNAVLVGVWGVFGYHALYYLALDRIPAAEGAVLATTWSFWIVVLGTWVQHRRLRPGLVLGAAIGLLGAGWVISGGQSLEFDPEHAWGYLMALGCGLIWSTFSVSLNRLRFAEDPMPLFTVLAAVLSILLWWSQRSEAPVPEAPVLWSAAYVGLVPLGLSFTLWNLGMQAPNLAWVGMLSYLTPPLGVLMVSWFQEAPVSNAVWIGLLLILLGALLCHRFSPQAE